VLVDYLFIANPIILVIVGAALLVVWRRHVEQHFVRDMAGAMFAAALTPLGLLMARQASAPLVAAGFLLLLVGSVANLVFMITGVARLAGRPIGHLWTWVLAVALGVLFVSAWALRAIPYWQMLVLLIVVAVGLLASRALRHSTLAERMVGPLLVLLGLNQLFMVFWGQAGASESVLGSLVLRLAIGLLFIFSALDRSGARNERLLARFERLTEHSQQGVLVTDAGRILYSNSAANAIYGVADMQALDHAVHEGDPMFARPIARTQFQLLRSGAASVVKWDGTRQRADGALIELSFCAWRIDWSGQPAIQILITDETEKVNAARALAYQSEHDELTGLPNRTLLIGRLRQRCGLDAGAGGFGLLILNIKRFKLFNQSYGHPLGDQVIQAFSARLVAAMAGAAEVMRIGGDEFALLSAAGAAADLEPRLRAMCGAPFCVPGGEFYLDLSMGMARFPEHGADADALLRAANGALHAARGTPGTSLMLAEAHFGHLSSQALELEQALRKGIRNDEICLHYQPKVDATDGRLLGFEALARWDRPGFGPVSPVEFIAVAERTGLIGELGAMLILKACRQIASWTAQLGHCVPVAVNVAPAQLLNAEFVQRVADVLAQCEVAPHLLTLEITESAAIDNLERARTQIGQLRALGVLVAMDDFGTGFSSLSMLRNLPLHALKIDRALIDPLPAPDAQAVVTAICQLAAALKLQVVAEGIETEAHAAAARLAGCDELQGYLYSRPMTSAQAALWLTRGGEAAARPAALQAPATIASALRA
jgi:diguanylate cyclase (GGDEF)-like protein/PAS domain S-box-containing protein